MKRLLEEKLINLIGGMFGLFMLFGLPIIATVLIEKIV